MKEDVCLFEVPIRLCPIASLANLCPFVNTLFLSRRSHLFYFLRSVLHFVFTLLVALI